MHTLLVSFAKSADEEIQLKSVTGLGKAVFCLLQYLRVLGIVFFLVQYMYNNNIRCQFSIANTEYSIIYFSPGFFYLRYPEMMLEQEPKLVYQDWLGPNSSVKKKCQVSICLRCIWW